MGLSNHNVVTRWVGHNTGRSGSHRDYATGSSMKFQGPVIFSYRAAIGRFYENYVLIITNRWGVTTARHIRMAFNRAYGVRPVFTVPSIGYEADVDHDGNLRHLERVFKGVQVVAIKEYRNQPDGAVPYWTTESLRASYGMAAQYAALTHTPMRLEKLDYILAYIDEQRREKWAVYHEPKAVARRERVKARKEAKLALLGDY